MDRFCAGCGAELTLRQLHPHEPPRQVCPQCGRVYYRNAKPCVEVLVVREGRALLIQRAIHPGKGLWDIPGGFLEEDELPEAGAVRELREETGLDITITGLLGIYLDTYQPPAPAPQVTTFNVCYLATAVGDPVAGDDAAAAAWFAPDELPTTLAFTHQPQVFRDWQRQQSSVQYQP